MKVAREHTPRAKATENFDFIFSYLSALNFNYIARTGLGHVCPFRSPHLGDHRIVHETEKLPEYFAVQRFFFGQGDIVVFGSDFDILKLFV